MRQSEYRVLVKTCERTERTWARSRDTSRRVCQYTVIRINREAELTDLQTTSRGVARVAKLATSTKLSTTVNRRNRNVAKEPKLFFNNSLKLLNIRSPNHRHQRASRDPTQSLPIVLPKRDLWIVRKTISRWDRIRAVKNSLTSSSTMSL